MKAAILSIGDELLIGQTINTNAAWIGGMLSQENISITASLVCGDEKKSITDALNFVVPNADLVIITGGLGPTKDDITKKVVAEYLEMDLVFNEVAWLHLTSIFKSYGKEPIEMHRQQCFLPQNCELLHNRRGTAPGMWMVKDGKLFISLPGVPYEMKDIFLESFLPKLALIKPQSITAHRTILTVGVGESSIASTLSDFENGLPAHIKLAYLPSLGLVKLRLTGIGNSLDQLVKELNVFEKQCVDILDTIVWGKEDETLESLVGQLCLEKELMIGTAESCTGGAIAALLTSVPGASKYFKGSVVAYSNMVKKDLLKVSPDTLLSFGAVSIPTVEEMAVGLLDVLDIDVSVAVSGIAGPSGGSVEKPVGTICIAVSNKSKCISKVLTLGKDRENNIKITTVQALDMLRRFLLAHEIA